MKRLYVCGSFRFVPELERIARRLKEQNIPYQTSKKRSKSGILGCLKKIDQADVIYVVNPEGYIGKSVSLDVGYAYAKNKSIVVMHPVDDPPLADLIDHILPPEALIEYLRKDSFAATRVKKRVTNQK